MTLTPCHPASAFDIFNVYFECLYDPTMHLVFDFSGRIDEDVLKKATLRLIEANPYLKTRFAEESGMPCWEEIGKEECERAFVLLPLKKGGASSPPPPIDVRRGPQLRVILSGGARKDRVIVSCHHGFSDAAGLKVLAAGLFAVYRGIQKDPGYRPVPTGHYDRGTRFVLERFTGEELREASLKEEPFVDRWRFPVEERGRGTPQVASRTLSPSRLEKAKEWGRKHGATINDIVIAAFFLALLKVRSDPSDSGAPRSLLTSADLRRYPGAPEEYPPMNLSVAFEVTLMAGEGAGMEEIIGQVTEVTGRHKREGFGVGCILFYDEVCAGGMPAIRALFDEMIRKYGETGLKNPVFSNIGIFEEGDFLPLEGMDGLSLALSGLFFIPCACWPYTFLMALSTFRGRITIVTAYEEGPYSKETVEKFLGYVDMYLP